MSEESSLSEAMQDKLSKVLNSLSSNPIIIDYQMIEKEVNEHAGLSGLIEEIKAKQKEAVAFAHYGKPEAEKVALKEADALTKSFEEHPMVVLYREKLLEANDLIQHITNIIEEDVRQALLDDKT